MIGRVWHLSKSLPTEPLSEFQRLLEKEESNTEVERLRKERIGQVSSDSTPGLLGKQLCGHWRC